MKILPFPYRSEAQRAADQEWLAELDAALTGHRHDADAAEWRQLADDVRALPPAISEDFELRLQRHVDEWRGAAASATPPRRLLPSFSRPFEMGSLLTAAVAIVVALVLVAPWRSSTRSAPGTGSTSSRAVTNGAASSGVAKSNAASAGAESAGPAHAQSMPRAGASHGKAAGAGKYFNSEAPRLTPGPVPAAPLGAAHSHGSEEGPAESANSDLGRSDSASRPAVRQLPPMFAPFAGPRDRVQQRAASITLATASGEVESVDARVSHITTGDGGFVQSSHVEVKRRGLSEAHLMLRIPSAKLSEALASLEALAPVKDKSQSLQDITSAYDLAKQRLANVKAQRQALLRALAKAYTEAEIESLHRRLSLVSREVAGASAALQGIERRGRISTVQVTILGSSHPSGASGLTIQSGLHDAGKALTIALVVLLLALSILLPIALVLAALTLSHRAWRRRLRERSLDAT